jgi:hypothetical protein
MASLLPCFLFILNTDTASYFPSVRYGQRSMPALALLVQIQSYTQALEFLTHQTTCASEMLEKTTCENFCQKGPPVGGGTPWPGDTWHVPPGPLPADPCRRWHRRHVAWLRGGGHAWQHAATPIGGRCMRGSMPPPPLAVGACVAACRHPHWRQVFAAWQGRGPRRRQGPPGRTEADVPATAMAAGACRHWPRRHVPRVAWPGVPPLVGGLF